MDSLITEELIQATYIFCYQRLCNRQDAEDLAQEILCEALKAIRKQKDIKHFYSWYWKMANNRYATFLSLRSTQAVSLEVYQGTIENVSDLELNVLSKEEHGEVNYAISRLAAIYREILILFYLKEHSIGDIAELLGIPVGTVKGRLFDARKHVREGLECMYKTKKVAYAPVTIGWSGGGKVCQHYEYLSDPLIQQIMVLCRTEPKTIVQVGDEMNVAPIYLERHFRKLEKKKFLKQHVKGKYLTDITLFPMKPYVKASIDTHRIFYRNEVGKEVVDILYQLKDELTSYDFYGNHFDYEYLMWIWIMYACRFIGEQAMNVYANKYSNKILKDNGKDFRVTGIFKEGDEEYEVEGITEEEVASEVKFVEWSNLTNGFHTADYGLIQYVNSFQAEPFPNRDCWINTGNSSLLIELSKNPGLEVGRHGKKIVSNFIEQGVVKKEQDKVVVNVPIIQLEVLDEICAVIRKAVEPLAIKYEKLISQRVEELLLPHIRKDLLEEFVHWNIVNFFQPTGDVFYYAMYNEKILTGIEDFGHSAAGLCIVLVS